MLDACGDIDDSVLVKIGFMAYYVWFRRNKVVFEEPTGQTRAWSIWRARR